MKSRKTQKLTIFIWLAIILFPQRVESSCAKTEDMVNLGILAATSDATPVGENLVCGVRYKSLCGAPIDLRNQIEANGFAYSRLVREQMESVGKAVRLNGDRLKISVRSVTQKRDDGKWAGESEYMKPMAAERVEALAQGVTGQLPENGRGYEKKLKGYFEDNLECSRVLQETLVGVFCALSSDKGLEILDFDTTRSNFSVYVSKENINRIWNECNSLFKLSCTAYSIISMGQELNNGARSKNSDSREEAKAVSCENMYKDLECLKDSTKCSQEIKNEIVTAMIAFGTESSLLPGVDDLNKGIDETSLLRKKSTQSRLLVESTDIFTQKLSHPLLNNENPRMLEIESKIKSRLNLVVSSTGLDADEIGKGSAMAIDALAKFVGRVSECLMWMAFLLAVW